MGRSQISACAAPVDWTPISVNVAESSPCTLRSVLHRPGNSRYKDDGGSNVICHLFPTRHIYAHKSFPTLCLAGFLVIIGHLCHSHPVHCLGNTLTALSFVVTLGFQLPLSNLAANKPAPCVSTVWPALSNLAGLWKVVVGPGSLTVFWNMPTGTPFFALSPVIVLVLLGGSAGKTTRRSVQ